MSEPGKRADGGVHTWIVCPDCHAGVRASRHSPEDCDALFAAKAELATANAKIARVEQTVAFLDPGQFDRSLALRDGGYSWGFHKARYGAVADVRRALESATPKPTDNSEDDQC